MDVLSFWNIPTQQQHGVVVSPNKNMKMIIPQNCCVVQLGLHEFLPVGGQVIPRLFKGKRITAQKVMVMMIDKNYVVLGKKLMARPLLKIKCLLLQVAIKDGTE